MEFRFKFYCNSKAYLVGRYLVTNLGKILLGEIAKFWLPLHVKIENGLAKNAKNYIT